MPARTATTETLAETFQRDGIVILPDFYSQAELAELNADLDRHWQQAVGAGTDAAFKSAYSHIRCEVLPWMEAETTSAAVAAHYADPRLAAVTAEILGEDFANLHSSIMFTLPGGTGQSWHQDCQANPERFNVNRLIYTRDVTADDGPLVMVPGSHRASEVPVGGPADVLPGERRVLATAGTLVLMHGRCYHRVEPNRTDRPRVSVNFRVKPAKAEGRIIEPIYRHMDETERESFYEKHFKG